MLLKFFIPEAVRRVSLLAETLATENVIVPGSGDSIMVYAPQVVADKIIAKGKKIAAHLMEASVADVVFENGTFKVAGTDKNVPLAQAVFAAYVPHNYPLAELEPGMDPHRPTHAAAEHRAVVDDQDADGAGAAGYLRS